MTRKLNVGDKVTPTWRGTSHPFYILREPCDYEPTAWWITTPHGRDGGWVNEDQIKLIGPPTFGLDVTFTNVDDAIAAATILSAHLNQPIPVIQK